MALKVKLLISKAMLEEYKNWDFNSCNKSSLIDIMQVKINTDKPLEYRFDDYLRSVKNPYIFRVDDVGVKINCIGNKNFVDSIIDIVKSN